MFIHSDQYEYRLSVSEVAHGRVTRLDPEALKDSALHNQATWEVEVCVVARLVDSPSVKAQNLFKIPFFEGAPVRTWLDILHVFMGRHL